MVDEQVSINLAGFKPKERRKIRYSKYKFMSSVLTDLTVFEVCFVQMSQE